MITILVNGDRAEVAPDATIAALVEEVLPESARRAGRGVAVALNGEVVPRGRWGMTQVEENDRVEVLTAIGGG